MKFSVSSDARRRLRRVLYIAVPVLIALVLYGLMSKPREAEVVYALPRDVVEVVVASGTLRAVRQGTVGAEAAGIVESLEVREGDQVEAGQLLGRLRIGDADARLAGALAALRAAETNWQGEQFRLEADERELARSRELFERRLVPVAELDDAVAVERIQRARTGAARAQLDAARAAVDEIRPEFGRREVRAPFAGVVLERRVEPGTAVSAATAWFRLAEMASTEIYVETDEINLGRLRPGQSAIAIAPAWPDRPFAARLVQVGPNVDSERGVVGLRLHAVELPDFVLPNMTVDVNIEVRATRDALALPAPAVATRGRPHVLAVDAGGQIRMQPVTVVGRNPDWVAVQGLAADVPVLTRIRDGRPGERISPVTPPAADPSAAGLALAGLEDGRGL